MRVTIVAESFLPAVHAVTNSALRTVEHLRTRGHEPVVVAPSPASTEGGLTAIERAVRPLSSGCRRSACPATGPFASRPWGSAGPGALREVAPDVVHLASPFVLGWDAVRAARLLDMPTVAVYQTEVPTYAARYGVGGLEPLLWRRECDIHGRADVTLAPSTAACRQLSIRGVPNVRWWARYGHCPVPAGPAQPTAAGPVRPRVIAIGYVGRPAAEKQLEDLAVLSGLESVQDRGWDRFGDLLIQHYRDVRQLRGLTAA